MHPYLNKNINVQMISFVIPLYMNNQKEIDGYNRNARADTQVSIARGIAIYNSETDLVFANVFKRADDAMYQNKAAMKERRRQQESSE